MAKRPLDCLLYFLIGNDLPFASQYDGLATARNWGFKVPNESKLTKNLDEVFEFINYWDTHRFNLPYEIPFNISKNWAILQNRHVGQWLINSNRNRFLLS